MTHEGSEIVWWTTPISREHMRYWSPTRTLWHRVSIYRGDSSGDHQASYWYYSPSRVSDLCWELSQTWVNPARKTLTRWAFIFDSGFYHQWDREYIVWLLFYDHNFLHQTESDIMDLLEKSENIFNVAFQKKNEVLKLVTSQREIDLPTAANDPVFENLFIDTLDSMESWYARQQYITNEIERVAPWYYEYLHTIYIERLHFVESLFAQMVMFLAESEKNHIWALDPRSHSFHIPAAIQSKIDLIASICEFHRSLDPHYPRLHTLIEWTVRSWILIYKGFSSPAEQLRMR